MDTIHYHGTPIWGDAGEVHRIAVTGAGAFVSYARPDQIKHSFRHASSVAIDNGAFSAWKRGLLIDWTKFYQFLMQHYHNTKLSFFVIPDTVEGGEEENDRLIAQVPLMFREKAAPVWHLHEPIDRLVRLCEEWPKVCFGSSGQYAQIRTVRWHKRMEEAFDAIYVHRNLKTKIHGLRMLDGRVLGNYPLHSADSTNLACNVPKFRSKYPKLGANKQHRCAILKSAIEQVSPLTIQDWVHLRTGKPSMQKLWLDLETFCDIPIKNGTHAYAEGVEIMLFAWAIDDGPVSVHDFTEDQHLPAQLLAALGDESVLIYAHNSHFDRTMLRHALQRQLPGIVAGGVERWRDTMVKALAHGLPGALGALCEVLNVDTDKAKDKAGKQLIQLFCKPRPKNSKLRRATVKSHPAEWQRFVEYAGLDIHAMRAVDAKLPSWNYQGAELALWHRDQKINDRGVCVDVELAEAAIAAVGDEQQRLAELTQAMTDGEVQAATQRDAMLRHILEAFGVDLPDMQKSTLERRINDPDLPAPLRELLTIRLAACTTSTSKYKALMKGVSSDGRLRGTLQFCGASRTGRWAGRLFQPQNLPRPTLDQEQIDQGIEALKLGVADLVFDNIMELTSSALRGCIMAPPGKKLVVSDLSNIEGRFLAWLAGEEWKLQAFRDYDNVIGTDENGEPIRAGHDLYKLAYARAFNMTPEDVDKAMRQIGKVMELGLGFGGGVAAFVTFALVYGLDLEDLADAALPNIPIAIQREAQSWWQASVKQKKTYGLSERVFITCDSLKRLWRNAHPETASLWSELENAVRRAIAQPGKQFNCRRLKVRKDGSWLRIALPSGRVVCYPGAAIVKGDITYMGVNPYSRKWQRLKTYGGKLVENVTQAGARDVLAGNMPAIEARGYEIVLTVHDEVITEAPDKDYYFHDQLSRLLATNPAWAPDLPLNAGGFEAYHYRKD